MNPFRVSHRIRQSRVLARSPCLFRYSLTARLHQARLVNDTKRRVDSSGTDAQGVPSSIHRISRLRARPAKPAGAHQILATRKSCVGCRNRTDQAAEDSAKLHIPQGRPRWIQRTTAPIHELEKCGSFVRDGSVTPRPPRHLNTTTLLGDGSAEFLRATRFVDPTSYRGASDVRARSRPQEWRERVRHLLASGLSPCGGAAHRA